MSQETERRQPQKLEIDRERYLPDWAVREAVGLALQTQLREPILEAVRRDETVETPSESGTEVDVTSEADEEAEADAGGSSRRVRGLVGLAVVAVGLSLAYWALSKKRD